MESMEVDCVRLCAGFHKPVRQSPVDRLSVLLDCILKDRFPEPIMIKAPNARILQDNCLACHEDLVHGLVVGVNGPAEEVRCVHCHVTVGHGDTTGLGGPE